MLSAKQNPLSFKMKFFSLVIKHLNIIDNSDSEFEHESSIHIRPKRKGAVGKDRTGESGCICQTLKQSIPTLSRARRFKSQRPTKLKVNTRNMNFVPYSR